MSTEIQGVLFYTEQEHQEAIATSNLSERNTVVSRISDNIVAVLKSEVSEGNLTLEYANTLYDNFCDMAGLNRRNITNTYTVTVFYDGNEVAEFTGVEASDEDSACSEVEENLELDEVEIHFSLSYNGDYANNSVSLSPWDWDSDFSFVAVEE